MQSLAGQARREPRVDEANYTVKAEANGKHYNPIRGSHCGAYQEGSGWDRSKARRARSYGVGGGWGGWRKVKVRSWVSGKRSGQSGKSEHGVQKGAKQGEVVLNRHGTRPAVVFPCHTVRGSGASKRFWLPQMATKQSRKTETMNWRCDNISKKSSLLCQLPVMMEKSAIIIATSPRHCVTGGLTRKLNGTQPYIYYSTVIN